MSANVFPPITVTQETRYGAHELWCRPMCSKCDVMMHMVGPARTQSEILTVVDLKCPRCDYVSRLYVMLGDRYTAPMYPAP